MKTRTIKKQILFYLTAICFQLASAQAAPRPNILYLYADDLGWGMIAANQGSETLLITPAIDSLAAGGINFRRAYGCMVCSPARSSQQTGFHQGHTWSDRNDPAASKAMRKDDQTIGDLLGASGYRMGYYGKWGYGADSTKVDPLINNIQTLPVSHGYNDLLAELHHSRAHTFFQPSLWFNNTDTDGTNTFLVYNANDGGHKIEYADDLYAEATEAFIRAHANDPEPFCAILAFQIPHAPLGEIENMPGWFDDYNGVNTSTWDDASKQYAAMVTRQDNHIANLLAALDDPNGDGNSSDSIRANTLVIFASDNGGYSGTNTREFFNTNGRLIGSKGSVKEGGIRVPTVFNWPGTIAPGQTMDHITCVSDIMPTLCELAGVTPPAGIDGVSIAPLLTGQGRQRVRPWFTHESGSSWSLIRNDGIKLRNTGALYNLADGSNTNYEATDLLANTSDPMYPTYLQWKNEMQAIAMAERVTEADTFANTYHHWIGPDGGLVGDADHWSDYTYANAGITYISETGAPRERWNATLANTNATDQTAILGTHINVLGIDVAGNPAASARQIVNLDGRTLTGRNEIRLSPLATVELNGGTLASTRWVDQFEGSAIQGPGTIDAILYNAGALDITTDLVETSITNITIIPGTPGSGGDGTQLITVTGAANSTAKGSSDAGTFATPTLVGDNTAPPGTLIHTISGLTLDDTGTDDDRVVLTFTVTTDGNRNIQTSGTTANGWLSPGDTTLNSNGDWIQISLASMSVDLNGGTGNGTGTFEGFTAVNFGSWAAGHVAVINGVSHAYVDGKVMDLTPGGNDANLNAWFDTVANTGAATDAAGSWRPEGWDFQLTVQSTAPAIPPTPPTTNIVIETVSSQGLVISNNYYQSAGARLDVPLFNASTSLVVNGTADLAGRLECSLPTGFAAANGDRFAILSANSVLGMFNNPDGMLEKDGHDFRIHYSADHVELEKVAVTTAGTPHWWMKEHGLTNATYEAEDLLDIDGDGLAAWEEYIAGTRPDMASSTFVIEPGTQPIETGFIIRWPSVSGRIYHLYGSTNLADGFQLLKPGIPAHPPENTYTDTTEIAKGFYRAQTERN